MALTLKAFAVATILFLFANTGVAQISVPDYSFTGKEITGFTVKPGYTAVKFDFRLPSKMDIYLQKQKSELNVSDKQDYSADEPGFMYSGSVSTSVSSIFVGDKAYRNNIVKMFLQKGYIDVITSYVKYSEKLEKSEYKDEVTLLYGLSLYETGNHTESFQILSDLAVSNSKYAEMAQDSLFQKLDNLNRLKLMEEVAAKIEVFSPYSLALWLKQLNSSDKHGEILNLLNKNKSFEESYPEFIGLRVSALYFMQRYSEAAKFELVMRGKPVYPLIVDAMIMSGNIKGAVAAAAEMSESEVKKVILTKVNIAQNQFRNAGAGIKSIKDDKEKLALFFYAVTNKFNEATPSFISSFNFADKQNNDYVNFYAGLKYLALKDYPNALNKFSLVAFNKDLITSSYFYQGMAAIHVDISRAEWNFMRFIGSGLDKERVMLSKFMVSQLYFLKHRYDDALMLVDDCSADYCNRLKADLFLAKGEYGKSISISAGINDDRTHLIRATAYYNLLNYKSALGEIVKIKERSPDSEYLLMMSLFKNKRYDDAIDILENNKNDGRIFAAGVSQLLLAGDSKKALSYIDTMKDLSPAYKLEKAKLLQAVNRLKEAEKLYKELIGVNEKTYESLQGLFQIASSDNNTKDFISSTFKTIEKSKPFDNKDLIVSQFAAHAMDLNEPNLAISYVNYFTDNFSSSPYLINVLRTRARLFKFTGRYENCVADADSVIKLDKGGAGDAIFIKAECMEYVDKGKAVSLYREMAVDNNRFYQPASGKLAILSDNAEEVLAASERMKSVSPEIYVSGIVRFLEIADNTTFITHSEGINKLAATGSGDIRSVAIWRIGKDYFEREMYEESARQYLKGYYLFPDKPYAVKNLEGAKSSYEVRKMKAQSDKVVELLSKYNIEKKKTGKKVN